MLNEKTLSLRPELGWAFIPVTSLHRQAGIHKITA